MKTLDFKNKENGRRQITGKENRNNYVFLQFPYLLGWGNSILKQYLCEMV